MGMRRGRTFDIANLNYNWQKLPPEKRRAVIALQLK